MGGAHPRLTAWASARVGLGGKEPQTVQRGPKREELVWSGEDTLGLQGTARKGTPLRARRADGGWGKGLRPGCLQPVRWSQGPTSLQPAARRGFWHQQDPAHTRVHVHTHPPGRAMHPEVDSVHSRDPSRSHAGELHSPWLPPPPSQTGFRLPLCKIEGSGKCFVFVSLKLGSSLPS